MKTQSMQMKLSLLAMILAALLMNCSGKKEDHATHAEAGHDEQEHASGNMASLEATTPQFEVDTKFREQLDDYYNRYLQVKDALVAAEAMAAKQHAADMQQALASIDMKLLEGAAHNDWMVYLQPMQEAVNEISSTDDIEAQRKAFSNLSDNLYKSVKAFGLNGAIAYYEYCPMAFNNEGGYWLSSEEEIRNPYFGDKMLTCGVVKEKLQ